MRLPAVNDHVRLVCDLPERELARGEIGVVLSQWCAPDVAYEVEFHSLGMSGPTRALLTVDQIEAEESAELAGSAMH